MNVHTPRNGLPNIHQFAMKRINFENESNAAIQGQSSHDSRTDLGRENGENFIGCR